jgi:hypothetical protein
MESNMWVLSSNTIYIFGGWGIDAAGDEGLKSVYHCSAFQRLIIEQV